MGWERCGLGAEKLASGWKGEVALNGQTVLGRLNSPVHTSWTLAEDRTSAWCKQGKEQRVRSPSPRDGPSVGMKTGISPGLVENPPPFPNSGKVEGQKPGLDHLTAEELGSGQGPGARKAHRAGSESGGTTAASTIPSPLQSLTLDPQLLPAPR